MSEVVWIPKSLREEKIEITKEDGYEFYDEYGNLIHTTKIVLEKKKKEYPKTYAECCRIMGVELWNTLWGEDATEYEEKTEDLIDALIRLKVCRDAYWKIAGEEMGSGKSWKPDFRGVTTSYVITVESGRLLKSWTTKKQVILAFPTKEMRDTFHENFKELIEQCKEFL